jgi:hypothetical protein
LNETKNQTLVLASYFYYSVHRQCHNIVTITRDEPADRFLTGVLILQRLKRREPMMMMQVYLSIRQKRKQCIASPKKANKGKKRSNDDVVVAVPDVVVAPTLADCSHNMFDDDYFDDDDDFDATDNDSKSKWRGDGNVVPGVRSARQASEESKIDSGNDGDEDDDELFSKFQLLDCARQASEESKIDSDNDGDEDDDELGLQFDCRG